MIIALSGYAKSGKDTVANILVEEFGFTKFSFAAKMKEAVVALDPIIMREGSTIGILLSSVLKANSMNLDKLKLEIPEVRRLLQRMGTEVGRKIFGEDFWVDLLLNSDKFQEAEKCVISDCRFQNEADASSLSFGGEIWRINRPGIYPANDHISEIALDHYRFDRIIKNDKTIEDLKITIREIIEQIEMD